MMNMVKSRLLKGRIKFVHSVIDQLWQALSFDEISDNPVLRFQIQDLKDYLRRLEDRYVG